MNRNNPGWGDFVARCKADSEWCQEQLEADPDIDEDDLCEDMFREPDRYLDDEEAGEFFEDEHERFLAKVADAMCLAAEMP